MNRIIHRLVARGVARAIAPALRYAARLEEVDRLPEDDGLLKALLEGEAAGEGPVHYLLNGHFNHDTDLVTRLKGLHARMARGDRVVAVCYGTLLRGVAARFGLTVVAASRENTVTRYDVADIARLAGFEMVLLRRPRVLGFCVAWVVYLRPVKPDPMPPSVSVIVPARNEAGNIPRLFDEMPRFPGPTEIILVEGHSTDGTADAIRGEMERRQPLPGTTWHALTQPGSGKDDAVCHGLRHATGELCVILDADLTVPPAMLLRFYETCRDGLADFVNGSRLLYPVAGEEMRFFNRVGNVLFVHLLSRVLGMRVTDALCGTKLFRRDDWLRMRRWRERFGSGDPFGDFDLLFACADLAIGCVNLPVQYATRTYGSTNIHRFRSGWSLLRMTLRGVVWFRLKGPA
ncbi:MAG: glycosyltransferase family 2 protein [Nitrospirota bacterium]|nr:glycosyltransferase family 2 protein [Nitrospirota bacterium]